MAYTFKTLELDETDIVLATFDNDVELAVVRPTNNMRCYRLLAACDDTLVRNERYHTRQEAIFAALSFVATEYVGAESEKTTFENHAQHLAIDAIL